MSTDNEDDLTEHHRMRTIEDLRKEFLEIEALRKELAEAKAALEVYDRTFPKKSELELHAALEAANARAGKCGMEGHNEPCHYCGEPCNSLVGWPSRWPVALCHEDDPGVVKWHHTGCVMERLAKDDAANARIAELEAWKAHHDEVWAESTATVMEWQDKAARAERAEATVAELEHKLTDHTNLTNAMINTRDGAYDVAVARAERVEAALKEQLQWKKSYTERAERAEFEGKNLSHNLREANARIAEFADKGTLQALRDANNRAERAEARIGELEDQLSEGRTQFMHEIAKYQSEHCFRLLYQSERDEAIARAERAEAEADSLRATVDNMRAMNIKLTMEATGQVLAAEAECKGLREALENIATDQDPRTIAGTIARAALNPSPAGEKS